MLNKKAFIMLKTYGKKSIHIFAVTRDTYLKAFEKPKNMYKKYI